MSELSKETRAYLSQFLTEDLKKKYDSLNKSFFRALFFKPDYSEIDKFLSQNIINIFQTLKKNAAEELIANLKPEPELKNKIIDDIKENDQEIISNATFFLSKIQRGLEYKEDNMYLQTINNLIQQVSIYSKDNKEYKDLSTKYQTIIKSQQTIDDNINNINNLIKLNKSEFDIDDLSMILKKYDMVYVTKEQRDEIKKIFTNDNVISFIKIAKESVKDDNAFNIDAIRMQVKAENLYNDLEKKGFIIPNSASFSKK